MNEYVETVIVAIYLGLILLAYTQGIKMGKELERGKVNDEKLKNAVATKKYVYWFCSNCKEEIDGKNVTNAELHDKCGYPVKLIETPL